MSSEEFEKNMQEVRNELYDKLKEVGDVDSDDFEMKNVNDLNRLFVLIGVAYQDAGLGFLQVEFESGSVEENNYRRPRLKIRKTQQ
ncbi:MAG: hypothetical protein IKP68_07640 [Clostridia bacterium]|nr:hypothetical protein [Clostridia bacterium]